MAFSAYRLRCSDGSYYTGHTEALEPRLAEHRLGMASAWTRNRLPVRLVWSEAFETREEALAAERQIKGWSRAKKEALIAGEWDLLRKLSRSRAEET
ncbi:MAG: GIY-YIG nuclease family protein [Dehalococcoidia bacterium]